MTLISPNAASSISDSMAFLLLPASATSASSATLSPLYATKINPAMAASISHATLAEANPEFIVGTAAAISLGNVSPVSVAPVSPASQSAISAASLTPLYKAAILPGAGSSISVASLVALYTAKIIPGAASSISAMLPSRISVVPGAGASVSQSSASAATPVHPNSASSISASVLTPVYRASIVPGARSGISAASCTPVHVLKAASISPTFFTALAQFFVDPITGLEYPITGAPFLIRDALGPDTVASVSGTTLGLRAGLPPRTVRGVSASSATLASVAGALATGAGMGSASAALLPVLSILAAAAGVNAAAATTIGSPLLFPVAIRGLGVLNGSLVAGPPTVHVIGSLLDPSGTPVVDAVVSAQITGLTYNSVSSHTISSITTNAVSTVTDSQGNWGLNLVASLNLFDPSQSSVTVPGYTFTLNAASPNPIVFSSQPFSQTAQNVSNVYLVQTNVGLLSGVPMVGFVYDASGTPQRNKQITAHTNSIATDTLTQAVLSPANIFSTLTDNTGKFTLFLPPTSRLAPAGTMYTITEQRNSNNKIITVPDGGGNVDDNILSTTAPLFVPIAFSAVSADTAEAYSADTLSTGSNFVNTLNRLRAPVANLYNISSPAQLSSVAGSVVNNIFPVSGNLALTLSATTDSVVTNSISAPAYTVSATAVGSLGGTSVNTYYSDLNGFLAWYNDPSASGSSINIGSAVVSVIPAIKGTTGTKLVFTFATSFGGGATLYQNPLYIKLSPADSYTASRWFISGVYATIINASFSIVFAKSDSLYGQYKIFYEIQGGA